MKKVVPAHSVLVPDQAKRAFKGKIFDVYQWPQKLFDGSEHTFEMLKRPDTVLAVCVVDDSIIILDDEQPHTGVRKSFPGGRVDETDKSIQAAAVREVQEETGYSFKNWRLIKVWQPHTKMEWFIHLLVAWDVEDQQPVKLDAGEKITVERLPINKLPNFVIDKSVDLSEGTAILKNVSSVEQLLVLPEFQGQTVDR